MLIPEPEQLVKDPRRTSEKTDKRTHGSFTPAENSSRFQSSIVMSLLLRAVSNRQREPRIPNAQ